MKLTLLFLEDVPAVGISYAAVCPCGVGGGEGRIGGRLHAHAGVVRPMLVDRGRECGRGEDETGKRLHDGDLMVLFWERMMTMGAPKA